MFINGFIMKQMMYIKTYRIANYNPALYSPTAPQVELSQ